MEDLVLAERIRAAGQEFGATTGRPRQVNWFDIDSISRAIDINGVTKLVINKVDVLEGLVDEGDYLRVYHGDNMYSFDSMDDMKYYIQEHIGRDNMDIFFSGNKDRI